MDHTKSKKVLAARMRSAFDDLFLADKNAHQKTAEHLKGWFKTKTGASDSVADKIARTFKVLATYADFNGPITDSDVDAPGGEEHLKHVNDQLNEVGAGIALSATQRSPPHTGAKSQFGLVYRFEIHLPDTQNVDTFRAIFRALREELL